MKPDTMHAFDPAISGHLAAMARAMTESLAFVFLDERGSSVGLHHILSGSALSIDVPLRTIVAVAMAHESRAIVMAHNHPSGDAEPSPEDLRTTRRVAQALDSLGIRLVDHLVLAGDTIVSFRARGLL